MSTDHSDIQSAVEESFERIRSMDFSAMQEEQKKNAAGNSTPSTPNGTILAYDLRAGNNVRALQFAADALKTPEEHRAQYCIKHGLPLPTTRPASIAPPTPTKSKRGKLADKFKSVFKK